MAETTSSHPTLSLLSTPWEYFVTIDQSALWQKHIAWAKPKGSDLKAYISSQYSSRMVLLSLLLATEMNVFFSSSPTLASLKQTLNIWDDGKSNNSGNNNDLIVQGFLPFWIGFFLLLNICVTISGILATFATWNVVSAISDVNAHCLLRSSLGQYVATLSPRLVVASLYLFLLWFLLFVVELLFGGVGRMSSTSDILHELLTKHLHLVLLWGAFLVAVTALFFSIVVPLSAFGRLVLHTGAMAEQPVLSESLQVELLPRGLHVGLVIKAHHSQKRGTAVTRQYQDRNKNRKRLRRSTMDSTDEEAQNQRQQQDNSHRVYTNNNQVRAVFSPPLTSTEVVNDFGDARKNHSHEEGPRNGNQDGMASSVVVTRFGRNTVAPSSGMSVSTGSFEYDNSDGHRDHNDDGDVHTMIGTRPKTKYYNSRRNEDYRIDSHRSAGTNESSNHYFSSFHQKPEITGNDDPRNRQKDSNQTKKCRKENLSRFGHRRIPTTETMSSLNLPPAAILNLFMTAKEFHDVIDSTMDTSSLFSYCDEGEGPSIIENSDLAATDFVESTEEGCNRNGEHINHLQNTEVLPTASGERHSGTKNSNHRCGIPLSPYPTSATTAQAADGGMGTILSQKNRRSNRNPNPNHQDLVTRHHRRVSSSRFLLEEWAQENRVRDLYGAAPLADLPHEIACMLENQNESQSDNEKNASCWHGTLPQEQQLSPIDNSITSSAEAMPSALNPSRNLSKQQPQSHWWLSPFSSHRTPSRNIDRSLKESLGGQREESSLLRQSFSTDDNSQKIPGENAKDSLKEPLLPDLTSFRDEELGDVQFSEL